MTALQLERLLGGDCTRCGAPPPSGGHHETNLCDACRDKHNARSSSSVKLKRQMRRLLGQCAFCTRPSTTYRCGHLDCPGTCRSALLNTVDSSASIDDPS